VWLDTDALFYGNFKNYSVESLHRVSGHCVGLLDYVNSYVWLNGPRNPAPMATVPREKFAAMFEGEKAHFDKMFAKVPKNVSLAIGQVTRERAKTYGLNYPKWKAMVEAATVVNTERLASLGNLVAGLVSRPVDVRVTADNGPRLKFQLAGPERKPYVHDGVIGEGSFGLNLKALSGFMQNSIVAGNVSISIGDKRGGGGKNDSSYGFSAPLAHGTVEIGGKTVIQDGTWTI